MLKKRIAIGVILSVFALCAIGLAVFFVLTCKTHTANKPQNKPKNARNTQNEQRHKQTQNRRNKGKRQAHKGKHKHEHKNTSKHSTTPKNSKRAKVQKCKKWKRAKSPFCDFLQKVERAKILFLRLFRKIYIK